MGASVLRQPLLVFHRLQLIFLPHLEVPQVALQLVLFLQLLGSRYVLSVERPFPDLFLQLQLLSLDFLLPLRLFH
ncbi:MAG: hypothetical protein ACRD2G_14685 [Terriglobia bacterium]